MSGTETPRVNFLGGLTEHPPPTFSAFWFNHSFLEQTNEDLGYWCLNIERISSTLLQMCNLNLAESRCCLLLSMKTSGNLSSHDNPEVRLSCEHLQRSLKSNYFPLSNFFSLYIWYYSKTLQQRERQLGVWGIER